MFTVAVVKSLTSPAAAAAADDDDAMACFHRKVVRTSHDSVLVPSLSFGSEA
jgi:hypothetical protein